MYVYIHIYTWKKVQFEQVKVSMFIIHRYQFLCQHLLIKQHCTMSSDTALNAPLVFYYNYYFFFCTAHVDNEMYLSRALERLGGNALSKDSEPDIGAAFFKFAVVTKELSALMKTLVSLSIIV